LRLGSTTTHLATQTFKRATASVAKFADEISGPDPVSDEICPLPLDLQFRSIIANFNDGCRSALESCPGAPVEVPNQKRVFLAAVLHFSNYLSA
jgi:hypothetical protein